VVSAVRDTHQRLFELTPDHRVKQPFLEGRPAEWGVQAEEHDANVRPSIGADGPGDGDRDTHRRVHRDSDRDDVREVEIRVAHRLNRQVHGADFMTGLAQEGRSRRNVEWLMAELIARDQEDSHTS